MRGKETESFRPIIDEAKKVVATGKLQSEEILPSAHPVVWDCRSDKLSGAHYDLPKTLRARAIDPAMTIILLTDVKSRQVGIYRKDGKPFTVDPNEPRAFLDTVQIAVIRWPERQLVGLHSIEGEAPPDKIEGRIDGENNHGPIEGKIGKWISTLHFQAKALSRAEMLRSSLVPASIAPLK